MPDPDNDKKNSVVVDQDLEDLIPEFLENRKEDTGKMTEALINSDFENLRIIGHSMKGSGGGYGFNKITEIGSLIEQAAQTRNSEEIKKQIEELSSFLESVEIIYE